MERATRDIVSRASYTEIAEGRGTPNGGGWLDATHLGKSFVESTFPGMTERTRNVGQALSEQPIEVSPTAHYHMGGVTIESDCRTNLSGLFAAGGAHGANRLGGNGVVDSTVLGKRAGLAMADAIDGREVPAIDHDQVEASIRRLTAPLDRTDGANVYDLRDELEEVMWENVGLVRTESDLEQGIERIEAIAGEVNEVSVRGSRRYNLEWQSFMDLENLIAIARLVAVSAFHRTESRGHISGRITRSGMTIRGLKTSMFSRTARQTGYGRNRLHSPIGSLLDRLARTPSD